MAEHSSDANPIVETVTGRAVSVAGRVLGHEGLRREGPLHEERADQHRGAAEALGVAVEPTDEPPDDGS